MLIPHITTKKAKLIGDEKMKKILQVFALMLAAVFMLTLTACRSDSLESEIVGAWAWDRDSAFEFVLEEDGTGIWGGAPFEWEIEDDELRMTLTDLETNFEVHRWTPTIEGDTLTITSLQTSEVYTYTRQ